MTKNGELFSSTFDLIIYFCVVEFVQIWGAVKAHCQITSSLPFFKVFFFFVSPPSQSISAPSTHGQTQPPSSPVQDMSMYLMMLMVVVLTTTARSFLGFYFILIRFLFFIYIKDSLVQSSLEQREEKGRGKKKAGKTSQSTRSLSKPQAEEVTSFNSFSCCVWCSGFVSAEKETTHRETHTHTHGQTQGSE